jgi:hypothetical protein
MCLGDCIAKGQILHEKGSSKPSSSPASQGSNWGLPETSRQILFAALVVLALALALIAFFLPPQDSEADGSEFYLRLKNSPKVGFLFDTRGAEESQASAIYQCGVDIISRGRFANKTIEIIACSQEGCLSSSTDKNGTSKISFDEAVRRLSDIPYIAIKPGTPSYKFFQRHMEIMIGKDISGNATCDIEATEG